MSRSSSPSRRVRAAVVAALVAAVTALAGLVAPAPASAHPFGDPQTVEVAADDGGDEVRVRWRAGGTDDLTLLAVALGVLPQDRVLLDGAVTFEESDPATLAHAEEFADYLLDRIVVRSAGAACPGSVASTADLAGSGAQLVFDCAAPVETAQVSVRTLTDLHPAYQTLARGPAGQRAVYDAEHPTHDWSFAGDGTHPTGTLASTPRDLGRSAATQLGAVVGIALLAVASGLLWLRRRGRRGRA